MHLCVMHWLPGMFQMKKPALVNITQLVSGRPRVQTQSVMFNYNTCSVKLDHIVLLKESNSVILMVVELSQRQTGCTVIQTG